MKALNKFLTISLLITLFSLDSLYLSAQPPGGTTIEGSTSVCPGATGVVYSVPYLLEEGYYGWSLPTGATIVAGGGTPSITVSFSASAVSGNINCRFKGPTLVESFISLYVTVGLIAPTGFTGSLIVCPGANNVGYSISPIAGATGYTWTLPAGVSFVPGTSTNTNSISVNFSPAAVTGNISVYGNSCPLPGPSATKRIIVGLPAAAAAIVGPNFITSGVDVPYSVPSAEGADGYNWELPSGATISSGANTSRIVVKFKPTVAFGTIKVTPTNICGGGLTSSLPVFLADFNTSGPITINPLTANRSYLLLQTAGTNLGAIGSDSKLYSGGNSNSLGMYVYGNNKLEFSTNNTKRLVISGDGNVGIGTTTPQEKLDVIGNIQMNGGANGFYGFGNSSASKPIDVRYNSQYPYVFNWHTGLTFSAHSYYGGIRFYNQGYPDLYGAAVMVMSITNNNVGIGTTNPQNKLDVAGTIRCAEVKVVALPWADFVFHPTYKLRTLGEVEQFIKINKHLPEIPTEAEVKENGVGLGEMNAKLLQKVEELTLYLIEMKKLVTEQQKQFNELKEQNLTLAKEMEVLKSKR